MKFTDKVARVRNQGKALYHVALEVSHRPFSIALCASEQRKGEYWSNVSHAKVIDIITDKVDDPTCLLCKEALVDIMVLQTPNKELGR